MFTKYKRLARAVNISSQVVYVLLLCGLLFLSGLDIGLRIYHDRNVLMSAGSSVVLLFLTTVLIVSARNLTVRAALHDIPKLYVPINPSDLPKRVHRLIQGDMSRVATIAGDAKPRSMDLLADFGWGKTGTSLENVHFRSAAIQTFAILEATAARMAPYCKRAPSVSARRYVNLLAAQDFVRGDLAHFYIERYEAIRFARKELTEAEYREFMKLFALLLKNMQYPQAPL
ncbi:hypothetical protein DFJ77DRAFT_529910 [Powellomyces hirtus]|nr:hypothetical protein DFJ77DRAFT_529910 [Powellomyces hirtus]